MVSTRSNSKSIRTLPRPSLDEDRRGCCIVRELVINGTDALKGGKPEPSRGRTAEVRTFRGARYEIASDGISWQTIGSKRQVPDESEESSSLPKKRLRQRAAASEGHLDTTVRPTAGKKRKLAGVEPTEDEEFLAETVRRLKTVKAPSKSFRKAEIKKLMPFLKNPRSIKSAKIAHEAPNSGHPRNTPDAYELPDAAAKAFLQSTSSVGAPVFLSGQPMPIIDQESNVRPIEQVLDWLDMDEDYDVDDLELLAAKKDDKCPQTIVKTGDVRERFTDSDQEQIFPWNFPDIALPTIAESMPECLRHHRCNMMNDIINFHQQTQMGDICQSACPHTGKTADRCPNHFITTEELAVVGHVSRRWLGTLMLAEAGAVTQPHFDSFGFGTYIVCAEGEIGFAWSGNALDLPDGVNGDDRWVYKVLRPGDAVYMDPGRYHLVFRLPGGKQTCGYAARVLRYCDVSKWLKVIGQEIRDAADYAGDDHPVLYRGILLSARHLLDQARKHGRFEKYGGEPTVRAAESILLRVENQLQEFLDGVA